MFGVDSRSDFSSARHQRARGALRVGVKLRDGKTVLETLRQEGCLKARFPRPVDWTEIVTLNTSGGVAGGDALESRFTIGAGARATIASQAAERFYRSLPGDPPSRIRASVVVEASAQAEWLPQESILFDRCNMNRTLDVHVAPGASFLGIETLVFGRKAMGEAVRHGRVADTVTLWRGKERVLHDAIRVDGAIAEKLKRTAIANGHCAVATIFHLAEDAEQRLNALRDALEPHEAGASAWNGLLVARILAPDGASLRSAIAAGLRVLRNDRPLPRVWMC